MASHEDCGSWEYKTHPQISRLADRCKALEDLILSSPKSFDRYGYDTRRGHKFMFDPIAPVACPCIVGSYRGDAKCACLAKYDVGIPIDPRVGVPYFQVAWYMQNFEDRIDGLMSGFSKWAAAGPSGGIPPATMLVRLVSLLAEALEVFFAIHPYANGNGHAGRLLVRVMMSRFSIVPVNWPIDRSPAYDTAIAQHRSGNKKPLCEFLLKAISDTP